MRNPRLMQEMMRNQDRALSNIEGIPGGFNQLSSLFSSIQEPQVPDPSTDEANRKMAERLGISSVPKDRPNNLALPNPWAPQPPQIPQHRGISFITLVPTSAFGGMPNLSNLMQMSGLNSGASLTREDISAGQSENTSRLLSISNNGPPRNMEFGMRLLQHLNNSNGNRSSLNMNEGIPPQVFSAMSSPLPPLTVLTPNTGQMQQQLNESIELRFREQLATLRDMGFTNDDRNKRALLASVIFL